MAFTFDNSISKTYCTHIFVSSTTKCNFPIRSHNPTLNGYTNETLIEEILSFEPIHSRQYPSYKPCAKVSAGLLFNHIIIMFNQTKISPASNEFIHASYKSGVVFDKKPFYSKKNI